MADLVQSAERLTGMMHDLQPEIDQSVSESALEAGLPPGSDEQIVARLREMVPQSETAPVRHVTKLPENSTIEGWVRGRTVSWMKTYQGIHFGGYRVGDTLVGMQVENHRVQYEGELNADGESIEGRWWIEHDGDGPTRRRAEGTFYLDRRRKPA